MYDRGRDARAVVLFETGNERHRVECVVAIGVADVSTRDLRGKEDHIEKGEQIGIFHFGGSTHCLMFGKEVQMR